MSTKRILGITAFGVLFIVAVIGVMLLTSFLGQDHDLVQLPDAAASSERPFETQPDALNRVEVTRETVQAVISTLSRPDVYSRDISIESFWESGQAEHIIKVSVANGMTSLRIQPSVGVERRIIVTPDTHYIWHRGDRTPFIGEIGSASDGYRAADMWQGLNTYEDILKLDPDDIIDAGYTTDEDSIFIVYLSSTFGYTIRYYVSIELGLVIRAVEHDENGMLVYSMTAGESAVGEVDPAEFTLPDGTNLLHEVTR